MGANQSNDGELAQERGWAGRDHSHTSGKGHSNVNKKSKAKPSPPLKVKAVDVTHSSISLSWLPPRHVDGGSVIAYTVEMATPTSGGDKMWKVLTKSCQGTNYDARHLEADTNYIFRVRAENIYGVGKHSSPSEVITTNIFETPLASDRTLGVPAASNTSPEKSPLGSSTSSKRFNFNMHLDGGVTSILNHSDIVLNSTSTGTPYSTSTLSLDKTDRAQSTLTRNNVQRTSWQSGRKVSLPILLPGTGQNSLNRLRESRNSLRTSTSDLQITNSTSRESTRNKFRDSRSSFGSNYSDVTVSTNSAEDSKKKSSGSRSSLQSSHSGHSDVTLSNSRDGCSNAGSKNSLCDSLNGNDSCEITDNTVLHVHNEINNKDAIETNNNNNKDDNRNEMDNQNETNDDDDDDVYKLKEQLKNMEAPEEKLKFCELQEKRNTTHDAILSPTCESQKGYYDSLENPWERDTSVDGMSERIMAAPFCDDIKMALYVKNLPEEHQSNVSEGQHPVMSNSDQPGDFRTLRSVLQSSNMIVKTSRSLPDVVGVVMGDGGESRTLTRGKLTTIMDADEEEDPVRVTTL